MKDQMIDTTLGRMAADIVSAYVANNSVPATQLSEIVRVVHMTLGELKEGKPLTTAEPAVPVRKSIHNDYIVCLEDGKKLKMLKRYLRTKYGMSPEEYRVKWNLPHDYPMVCKKYSEQRSQFAKDIGLGTSPKKTERRR